MSLGVTNTITALSNVPTRGVGIGDITSPIGDKLLPSAMFSLRTLRADYYGRPVINVRRSGDNAERAFASYEISGSSMANWITSNGFVARDAFVETWYNQSGGENAIQSNAGLQPKIWDASTGLVKLNGKPAMKFDSQYFEMPNTTGSFNYLHDGTDSTVVYVTAFAFNDNPEEFYHVFGNNSGTRAKIGTSVGYDDRSFIGGRNDCQNVYVVQNNLRVVLDVRGDVYEPRVEYTTFLRLDANDVVAADRSSTSVNGGAFFGVNTETNATVTSNATYNMEIGAGGLGVFPMKGYIQEIAFFASDETAAKDLVEENIRRYYRHYAETLFNKVATEFSRTELLFNHA